MSFDEIDEAVAIVRALALGQPVDERHTACLVCDCPVDRCDAFSATRKCIGARARAWVRMTSCGVSWMQLDGCERVIEMGLCVLPRGHAGPHTSEESTTYDALTPRSP